MWVFPQQDRHQCFFQVPQLLNRSQAHHQQAEMPSLSVSHSLLCFVELICRGLQVLLRNVLPLQIT